MEKTSAIMIGRRHFPVEYKIDGRSVATEWVWSDSINFDDIEKRASMFANNHNAEVDIWISRERQGFRVRPEGMMLCPDA